MLFRCSFSRESDLSDQIRPFRRVIVDRRQDLERSTCWLAVTLEADDPPTEEIAAAELKRQLGRAVLLLPGEFSA